MSFESIIRRVSIAQAACSTLLGTARKRFAYPWAELESEIAAGSTGVLSLVGYGTLLNPESARRTIPTTPEIGHPAVLAFGARRIFNYAIPDALFHRRGEPVPAVERAALNVEWSGRTTDYFNGRLLAVPPADLPALREREVGYHLDPVAYVPWDAPAATPQLAYVLRADTTPWQGRVVVDSAILPNPRYLTICRDGARLVDPAFEEALLTTTWLADGQRRLDQYLASND
jgi:hypothetical protein